MAAEIKPLPGSDGAKIGASEKPTLNCKIDVGHEIYKALLIKSSRAVITVGNDKYLKIWQRRDSGQYWPSICHPLPSSSTSLYYFSPQKRLFLGLENGTVMEFNLAEDLNSVSHLRDYLSHQNRVTDVNFSARHDWVLSTSRDKFFVYHCTDTGRRLGGHQSATGWCLAVQFDERSDHAFVADHGGQVDMLKLEENGCSLITTLKGHSGPVHTLCWDPNASLLYSGSSDQSIVVWDIGGGRGTAYELHAHTNKVSSLLYSRKCKYLMSGGDDGLVVFWDMKVMRQEVPVWAESDTCQGCARPFFWNWRGMVDQKQIGLRQHHCRKCGKAVCDSCSCNKNKIPTMGFEMSVRICDSCHSELESDESTSLAFLLECKHNIICIDIDEVLNILLTVGQDHMVKLWDVTSVLNGKTN